MCPDQTDQKLNLGVRVGAETTFFGLPKPCRNRDPKKKDPRLSRRDPNPGLGVGGTALPWPKYFLPDPETWSKVTRDQVKPAVTT